MPIYHQVISGKVFGKVLFLMCHIDGKGEERHVKEKGQVLRPVFVIVSAHNIYRSDRIELINYILSVNVPAMKDYIACVDVTRKNFGGPGGPVWENTVLLS